MPEEDVGEDVSDEELDELLEEAGKQELPLRNKIGEKLEDVFGPLPTPDRKIWIVVGAVVFLVAVYLLFIFIAPMIEVGDVLRSPIVAPQGETEKTAVRNIDRLLGRIENLQSRAEQNESLRNKIRSVGNVSFLLAVTSQREDRRVRIWSTHITVRGGRIPVIQKNSTRTNTDCIAWMRAKRAARGKLTGTRIVRMVLSGQLRMSPPRCATGPARKIANLLNE